MRVGVKWFLMENSDGGRAQWHRSLFCSSSDRGQGRIERVRGSNRCRVSVGVWNLSVGV